MTSILSIYLSTQVVLSAAFAVQWFVHRATRMTYREQLRLAYWLISGALALPFALSLTPAGNPFGAVVKVQAATPHIDTSASTAKSRVVNFRVPQTTVTPQMNFSVPTPYGLALAALIAFYILLRLARLATESITLARLVRNSFVYKSLGRVRVLLSPQTATPFSFHNGYANIVLPYAALAQPSQLKMALAHELQHHRQRDTLWVFALELTKVLFAVNPLVKKLIQRTMELQELACDEALVGHKRFSARAYGECLYGFAEQQLSKLACPAGAVGMAVETQLLKRRIEVMFQPKRKTSRKAFAMLAALGFITLGCAAWTFKDAVVDQTLTMEQARDLARKASAGQEIPIIVDEAVLHWLNRAVGSEASRLYMRQALQRMKGYEAMITEKLGGADLPLELLAVPLVESGYRNDVKSTMNAAGIWQFIPQTARRCGLEVRDKNDERLNPSRLTDAAVCYYRKLFAIFQNWHVAISAYNVGESRMASAISDAGHNDALKISRDGLIGREGRNYLPKVLAAMIILKNPRLVE